MCVGALIWVGHRMVSFETGASRICEVRPGEAGVGRVVGRMDVGEWRGAAPRGRVSS